MCRTITPVLTWRVTGRLTLPTSRMVGFNKRVLEAGCASGGVSKRSSAQGCTVVGIEIDASVVEPAQQWLERVIVGNFD